MIRELERRIKELEARVLGSSAATRAKYVGAYSGPLAAGDGGLPAISTPASPEGPTNMTTSMIRALVEKAAKTAVWDEIDGATKPDDNATASHTFFQDTEPDHAICDDGDLWYDTNDDNHAYRFNLDSDTFVSARDGAIIDLGNDGVITPVEKLLAKPEWDMIVAEGNASTGVLVVKATALGKSHTSFDSAYSALDTYLNTTLAVFADMNANTTVTRATWDTKWNDYFAARTALINSFMGSLAPKDTVDVTDINPGLSLRSFLTYKVIGTGSELGLGSVDVGNLDSNDAVIVTATIENNGATTQTYRLLRACAFESEQVDSIILPASSKQTLSSCIDFSDGYQPYYINEVEGVTDVSLFGGTGSETFIEVGQIFKALNFGYPQKPINAVEFYMKFTGTPDSTTLTAKLYDSDGSSKGSNLLATSTAVADNASQAGLYYPCPMWCRFVFPTPYTPTGTEPYLYVGLTRSSRSLSNYWNVIEGTARANSAALRLTSGTWAAPAGISDLAFKIFTAQTGVGWAIFVRGTADSSALMSNKMGSIVFRR